MRRHTWFNPIGDWLLNFWMGQDIDLPITVWEEMFLPSEVGRRIGDFWYTGPDGVRRKLVSDVEMVYEAKGRPAVLEVPRRQWPRELAFSLAVSVLLGCFFFLRAKKFRSERVLLGISYSLAGLAFGAAGLVLYFMSFFTNHDYTYHNANVLFGTPLLLASVPLGIRYALIRGSGQGPFNSELPLRLLWLLAALGIVVSMFIKLFPAFWQQNLTDQMLMLPIALTLALAPPGLRETLHIVKPRSQSK